MTVFGYASSQILWKESFWYNTMRAVGAALVVSALALLSGSAELAGTLLGMLTVGYYVILPIAYLCAYIPLGGFFTAFLAILLIPGDIVVWFIHRLRPELVPVENPGFIHFKIFMPVISPYLK